MPILIPENLHAGCWMAPGVHRLLWITNYLSVTWTLWIGLSTGDAKSTCFGVGTGWYITKKTASLNSEGLDLRPSFGIYQQSGVWADLVSVVSASTQTGAISLSFRKPLCQRSLMYLKMRSDMDCLSSPETLGPINHNVSLNPCSLASEVGRWTKFSQWGCQFICSSVTGSGRRNSLGISSRTISEVLKHSIVSALSYTEAISQMWLLSNWNTTYVWLVPLQNES